MDEDRYIRIVAELATVIHYEAAKKAAGNPDIYINTTCDMIAAVPAQVSVAVQALWQVVAPER